MPVIPAHASSWEGFSLTVTVQLPAEQVRPMRRCARVEPNGAFCMSCHQCSLMQFGCAVPSMLCP